jgi:hypothetical protein
MSLGIMRYGFVQLLLNIGPATCYKRQFHAATVLQK